MLKAGCLLFLLSLSLFTVAQSQNGDNLGRISPKDSLAPLKKWLAELISAEEQDTARVFATLNDVAAEARRQNNVLREAFIHRATGIWFRKLKQYHRSFFWYMR